MLLPHSDNARDEPFFPDGLETDAATLAFGADIASALLTLLGTHHSCLCQPYSPLISAPMTLWPGKPSTEVPSAPELAQPMHGAGQKCQKKPSAHGSRRATLWNKSKGCYTQYPRGPAELSLPIPLFHFLTSPPVPLDITSKSTSTCLRIPVLGLASGGTQLKLPVEGEGTVKEAISLECLTSGTCILGLFVH